MMSFRLKSLLFAAGVATMFTQVSLPEADAYGYGGRQYYSSWSYQPSRSYHYTRYYYQPTVTATTYHYHYCISYPSQPRYVYYYNPVSEVYWGRLDLEGKEGAQYSLLADKDRKKNLSDIPESAFPAPAALPAIPGTADNIKMEAITTRPGEEPADLPTDAKK